MKNSKLKYFIAVFFFCSTLAIFAQGPSEGTGEGIENDGSTDTTGTPAPIDDYVWVLAALGLVYVWKLRSFSQKEKTTQE